MPKFAFVSQASADLEIVIADDDPDEQLIIAAAALDVQPSTRIEFVDGGDELFDLLESRPDNLPDLLVIDLRSEAVGGYEALTALGTDERYWEVPVMVLGTPDDAEEADRCRRQGAVWVEAKPDSFNGYVELVRSLEQRCTELEIALADRIDWQQVFDQVFQGD